MLHVFILELKQLTRTKTVPLLLIASIVWMVASPYFIHGDGTEAGARQMLIEYSLGGVFAFTLIFLLSAATGTLAGERAKKRLQLTQIRPIRAMALVIGKVLAYVSVGAIVLAASAVMLMFSGRTFPHCNHVYQPLLPSIRSEAERNYAEYIADEHTPEEVKKAKKSAVIQLLEQREVDRYVSIATNSTMTWRFEVGMSQRLSARVKFSGVCGTRQTVAGVLSFGDAVGVVSNLSTQGILTIPLVGKSGGETFSFSNHSKSSLMLRPRRDLALLSDADGFVINLVRAYFEMLALLTLIVSFGVLLSAGLSRPVALFTAISVLALSEMSPEVLQGYPYQLDMALSDRIGLVLSQIAAEFTHPISAVAPLESLAQDICIEWKSLVQVLLVDMIGLPLLLAAISGLLVTRKEDGL